MLHADPSVGAFQLREEAVDHAALTSLVVEGLPDDAAGQGRRERADLAAQRGGRGLAVGLDLRVCVLDDASRLGLGLLPHLRDDRGALLTRLLADARRLVARVGDLGLELLLGRTGLGLGLVQLGELLADRVLSGRHRAVDRRDDELAEQEQQDREGGQLDEERGVRNEEVALHGSDRNACHRWVPLLASYRRGGCPRSAEDEDEQRHEGEVDEEHRLDQTDRQEEDGLQAALRLGLASHTLDVGRTGQTVTDTGTDRAARKGDATADEGAGKGHGVISYCHCDLFSSGVAPGAALGLPLSTPDPDGSVRWCGDGPARLCGLVLLAALLFLVLLVDLVLRVAGSGHREVEDREKREDEGLDDSDDHVEGLPEDVRGPHRVQRDHPDQRQHDAAGEDVAEESQGQRDRLDQLFEDVEREQHRERLREVLEVAAETLLPDAVGPHADHGDQGQCIGQVGVGRRSRQQVRALVELGGHELEPVGEQDEEEQRDRQRRDVRVHLAEVVLDLLVDLADDGLPQDLDLGGHVVAGVLRERASRPQAEDQHEQTGHDRRDDRVDVERHAQELTGDVVADLDGRLVLLAAVGSERKESRQGQQAGHGFFSSLSSGIVVITRAMSRKMARPSSRPMPSGQKITATPIATAVSRVRRTIVEAIIWLREGCSPDEIVLSSQYSVARWLTRPSRTPPAMQAARRHSPSCPTSQKLAIIRPRATRSILRWSLRTRHRDGLAGGWTSFIALLISVMLNGAHPRMAARCVVDEEAEDHADDDAAGQEAAESDEVAAAQPRVGASVGTLIDHPPKSHSSALLSLP